MKISLQIGTLNVESFFPQCKFIRLFSVSLRDISWLFFVSFDLKLLQGVWYSVRRQTIVSINLWVWIFIIKQLILHFRWKYSRRCNTIARIGHHDWSYMRPYEISWSKIIICDIPVDTKNINQLCEKLVITSRVIGMCLWSWREKFDIVEWN